MNCCQPNHTNETRRVENTFQPNIDIYETADEVVLLADVPGATKEKLDLSFEEGVLTMKAGVAPRQTGETPYLLREYPIGDYSRSFRLGESIDPARISAELNAGVLTIRMPKSDSAKPRKIAITNN
jgi:HSP20 family molecular chaperone IbpA